VSLVALVAMTSFAFVSVASEFQFRDAFSGAKKPDWNFYVPYDSPTESFDPAGFWTLQMPTVSTIFDHWSTVDNAPALYVDIPAGNQADDFFIETHLIWDGPASGYFQCAMVVYFSRYNVFYWGPYTNTNVRLEKSGVGALIDVTYSTSDVYLRIERTGQSYEFLYTTDPASGWISAGTITASETPTRVGLMGKTWATLSQDLSISFDYFLMNSTLGAYAGGDKRVYGGDRVTLTGSGPDNATSFSWAQVAGEPQVTLEPTADPKVVQFDAPQLQIGAILTFRLTVGAPDGTTTDDVDIIVTAVNPPKVAPTNLRVYPVDVGTELGFTLEWDPIVDAEKYQGALRLDKYYWLYTTTDTHLDFMGMAEGVEQTVAVRGENKFSIPGSTDPSKHGLQSEDVTYKAMRNLALPASLQGGYPPLPAEEGVTYVISENPITGMNNMQYDDSNDSWDGFYKPLDFWGYMWDQPYFFNHIVYCVGDMYGSGGWFTSLKIQVTTNGTTWKDAPILDIYPAYDFTDMRIGKEPFQRYDLVIPTLRGTGIRVAGTPGGFWTFTSISELEVFGDQTQGPIIVQGLDSECGEGHTATLDGSLSFSMAGPLTSYKWEFVSGPSTPTIQNSTGAVATFKAPNVTKDEVFMFKLTAGDGINTGTDGDVRIVVKNLVTTAVAGPDRTVPDGSEVTLDSSASLSTMGTLTYLWTQTAGTSVGVTGKTDAVVTFTAPVLWAYAEKLTFRLEVRDEDGGVSSDEVVIRVRNFLMPSGFELMPMDPADWQFQGSANYDAADGILKITPAANDMVGAAWLNETIDCTEFWARFKIYIGDGNGADGMVFGWVRNQGIGGGGGALGWYGGGLRGYGIVFDTYPQTYTNVVSFEDASIHGADLGGFVCYRPPIDMENAGWFDVEIEMDNGHLQMWMSNEAQGFPRTLAIDYTVAGYEGFDAYFGFTGATGGLNNNHWVDGHIGISPPSELADVYGARKLPAGGYQTGVPVPVELSLRVNPASTPSSAQVVEQIPPGLTAADVDAPGAAVGGGQIQWNLSGTAVKPQTLSYSVTPPAGMGQALTFSGTVSFPGDSSAILGASLMYAVPSEPLYLMLEMLMAAHLSWAAPATEGTASYNVFRSVNGGTWAQIGSTTATSFVDSAVTAGNNYSYAVSAVAVNGIEGPQSSPTSQAQLPPAGTFQVREAEDFNYDGGKFPWTDSVTVTALESPSATEIGTPEQYDYYHPNIRGPGTRTYRPLDNRNDQPDPAYADSGTGVAIDVRPEDNDPTAIVTKIGWINAGSWYRYGFNITQTGWIKLVFRVACPDGGTIAAYWDETLIGTASYVSGSWDTYTWAAMEQFEELTTGVHHLRVALLSGELDFDKIAIGFNWTPAKRETIWSDNFDTYTSDADVKAAGWTIENGSGYPDAAWRLWDTAGPMLNNQDPNLAGMYDKYMISDSDLAPDADLDERLVSKEVDCSNHMKVRLNFSKNYNRYEDPDHLQVAEVDIRVFDNGVWGNWVNLGHWDRDTGSSSTPEQMDIASLADKKKIQVRWHFYQAKWDYWFAIDQVRVSGEPLPTEAKIIKLTPAAGKVTLNWTVFGTKQYTVQQTDNLVGGPWVNAPGTWPISEQTWTSGDTSANKKLFYRVMGQ
jgi:hypothetical protein